MNQITRRNAIKGVAGLVGAAVVAPIPFLGEAKKGDFPEGKIYKQKIYKQKIGDSMWYIENDSVFCICESADYKVFFDGPGRTYIEQRAYKKGWPLIPPYWDNIIKVDVPGRLFTFTTIKGTDVFQSAKWYDLPHDRYIEYTIKDGRGHWTDVYWPEKHYDSEHGIWVRPALTDKELNKLVSEAFDIKNEMKARCYKRFNACFPKERLT